MSGTMMLPDIFERKQAPQAAAAPSRRHHVARCSSRHTADSAASAQAVNARSEVMSPPCASRAGQNTASTRASPPAARPNSPRAQRQVSQQVSTPNSAMAARPRWSISASGLPIR
jgi:hypothetical protein